MLANRMLASAGAVFSVTNTANPAASTGTGTTHTFSGVSFGDTGATRIVIVAISFGTNAVHSKFSSVTIGGVTATEIISIEREDADDCGSGIYAAKVPSGATGDVVVTVSIALGTNRGMSCSVFAMIGKTSVTAFATASDSDGGSAPDTTAILSLNIPAGGFVIGTSASVGGGAPTMTWTGAAEITEQSPGTRLEMSEAFSADLSVETPRTVTAVWSVDNTAVSGVSASWGP